MIYLNSFASIRIVISLRIRGERLEESARELVKYFFVRQRYMRLSPLYSRYSNSLEECRSQRVIYQNSSSKRVPPRWNENIIHPAKRTIVDTRFERSGVRDLMCTLLRPRFLPLSPTGKLIRVEYFRSSARLPSSRQRTRAKTLAALPPRITQREVHLRAG